MLKKNQKILDAVSSDTQSKFEFSLRKLPFKVSYVDGAELRKDKKKQNQQHTTLMQSSQQISNSKKMEL